MTEAPTSPATRSPGSEPGDPLIDWHRVAELRNEIGAEHFDEVVALFLTEVQATLDRLPAHPGSLQEVSEQLHFLKGSTLNLGFERLSALCEAGELAITAGLGAPLDPELLRRCYARYASYSERTDTWIDRRGRERRCRL